MKAIAKRTATKVKPTDLTALAAKILRAHAEARQAAVMIVEKAIEAGDALLKAKEQLGHGEWLPWLEASCPDISVRTVQVYMRLAKKRDTIAQMRNAAHLPIREAVAFLAKPRFWVADPAGSEEIEEAEEDEDGFHAILYQPIGMRFDERKCKTKAGAERIAEEWREHIAGLERKPSGEVCVVTAEKLDAMGWSCAVTPHTTQAEDAAIVADAKGEGKVAKPWKPRESPLRLAPFRKKGEREELKGEAMGILHRLVRRKVD